MKVILILTLMNQIHFLEATYSVQRYDIQSINFSSYIWPRWMNSSRQLEKGSKLVCAAICWSSFPGCDVFLYLENGLCWMGSFGSHFYSYTGTTVGLEISTNRGEFKCNSACNFDCLLFKYSVILVFQI